MKNAKTLETTAKRRISLERAKGFEPFQFLRETLIFSGVLRRRRPGVRRICDGFWGFWRPVKEVGKSAILYLVTCLTLAAAPTNQLYTVTAYAFGSTNVFWQSSNCVSAIKHTNDCWLVRYDGTNEIHLWAVPVVVEPQFPAGSPEAVLVAQLHRRDAELVDLAAVGLDLIRRFGRERALACVGRCWRSLTIEPMSRAGDVLWLQEQQPRVRDLAWLITIAPWEK